MRRARRDGRPASSGNRQALQAPTRPSAYFVRGRRSRRRRSSSTSAKASSPATAELELLGWLAADRSPSLGIPPLKNPRGCSPGTPRLRRDDRDEPRLLGRTIDCLREPGRFGDRHDRELGLGLDLGLVATFVSSPATGRVAVAAVRPREHRELLATRRAPPHGSHADLLHPGRILKSVLGGVGDQRQPQGARAVPCLVNPGKTVDSQLAIEATSLPLRSVAI